MQEIRLEGNIGRDAQVLTSNSGKQFATFSLGCSEKSGKKTQDGKDEFITTWYEVFCKPEDVPYLTKGKRVQVVGKPSFRAYVDKNNQPAVRCSVQFANIYFTMPKPTQNTQATQHTLPPANTSTPNNATPQDYSQSEDDLPF